MKVWKVTTIPTGDPGTLEAKLNELEHAGETIISVEREAFSTVISWHEETAQEEKKRKAAEKAPPKKS